MQEKLITISNYSHKVFYLGLCYLGLGLSWTIYLGLCQLITRKSFQKEGSL